MTDPRAVPSGELVTVVTSEWLTPTIVRVVFTGEPLAHPGFSDSYIKLIFDGSRRAYTVRWLEDDRFAIDFVVHGDEGLAGPWAKAAKPGDQLTYVGPGGAWSPRADADAHLFIADEAALPAVATGLDALLAQRPDAVATVVAEVAEEGHEYPLPTARNVSVAWVYRGDASYGERLIEAAIITPVPPGDVEVFLHGNADMVRPLRRYILRDRGIPIQHASISGYWRAGLTDEGWRAVKRDFNAQMEAET